MPLLGLVAALINSALVIVSAFLLLQFSVWFWGWEVIPLASNTAKPSGHGPYSFAVPVGNDLFVGQNERRQSPAVLFEDGKPLSCSNALHADIGNRGKGCYSFWKGTLYFSSSDNSDPRINGRRYELSMPRIRSRWFFVSWLLSLFSAVSILYAMARKGLLKEVKPLLRKTCKVALPLTLLVFLLQRIMSQRMDDLPSMLLVAATFYLLFRFNKKYLTWASYILFMFLFVSPLVWAWKNAIYDGNTIGGLLPFSDSWGYYADALHLMQGERLSIFSSRRPLWAGFLSVLLWVTKNNLQASLLLMSVLVAISSILLTHIVRTRLGSGPAALLLTVVFYCYKGYGIYASKTLTENLGLCLGAIALAAILYGISDRRFVHVWFGTLLMTLALIARAGAFFVLPMLILWAFFSGKTPAEKTRQPLLIISAIGIAFIINKFLLAIIGNAEAIPFANFGSTLYGLAAGYKGWPQAHMDHPGASDSEIFRYAFEMIKAEPYSLAKGIVLAYRDYFYFSGSNHMFSFLYLSIGPGLMLFALFAGSLIKALMQRTENLSRFIIFAVIGILASIPFVPPIDDGIRALTATVPIIGLVCGYLFTGVRQETKKEFSRDDRSGLLIALYGFALAILLVLGPISLKAIAAKTQAPINAACLKGEPVALYVADGAFINIEGDEQRSSFVPNIRVSDFRNAMKGKDGEYPHLWSFLNRIRPGSSLLLGWNRTNDKFIWLVTPHDKLVKGGINQFCAHITEDEWLKNYNFYFEESLVADFE